MDKLEFDTYELHEGGTVPPSLSLALKQNVNRFLVEFLDQQAVKPHVTLKIDFANSFPVQLGVNRTVSVYGCRLSMDFEGTGPDMSGGELHIKLLTYEGSSRSSFASFQFDVEASVPFHKWVYDILPLSQFDFQPANDEGNMAGCRDFIAQCMIEWNLRGLVSWNWSRQEPPMLTNPIRGLEQQEGHRGFHILIGNKFWKEGNQGVTRAAPHPITPGHFVLAGVIRKTEHRGHRIPYRLTV